MTRRDWVERLRTCESSDLDYLTALFNDWRQEQLGEGVNSPSLLCYARFDAATWYREGPELLRLQPIRSLEITDVFSVPVLASDLTFYCFDRSVREDLATVLVDRWFPPTPLGRPVAISVPGRYYSNSERVAGIFCQINRNALNWAVEESKKEPYQ